MMSADELEVLLATNIKFEEFETACRTTLAVSECDDSTRRRIVGYLVTCGIMRQVPVKDLAAIFQELQALGFPDAATQLLHAGAFARYCMNAGKPEAGAVQLKDALSRAKVELGPKWVLAYEPLLDSIEHATNADIEQRRRRP
jgi:hypothetical protein